MAEDQGYFGSISSARQVELKSHERHGNEWGTFQRVVAIDPDKLPLAPSTTICKT